MWGEPAPSISCACSFAPGKWFGKEELCLVMSSGYHSKLCPGTLFCEDVSFFQFHGNW